QVTATADPAAVRLLDPGQDLQQRGLAAAVEPDHPDPVALADAERHGVQQRPDPVRLVHCLKIDQIGHLPALPWCSIPGPQVTDPVAAGRNTVSTIRRISDWSRLTIVVANCVTAMWTTAIHLSRGTARRGREQVSTCGCVAEIAVHPAREQFGSRVDDICH